MANMPGITPHLKGRKLDPKGGTKALDIFAKPHLKEIEEENEEPAKDKEAKKVKKTKNALKNLKGFI